MVKLYRWVIGTVSGDFYVTKGLYTVAEATRMCSELRGELRNPKTDFVSVKIAQSLRSI